MKGSEWNFPRQDQAAASVGCLATISHTCPVRANLVIARGRSIVV